MLDLLKERLIMPVSNGMNCLPPPHHDHGPMHRTSRTPSEKRSATHHAGASVESLCALETMPLLAVLSGVGAVPEESEADAAGYSSRLSFYGPVRPSSWKGCWACPPNAWSFC